MGCPAHCQTITRSSPLPPSKSTSLSAVTQCYPRQPGKRLWRSNQLWLNTECDGSHYSKSRTAKALTTIDYLNIACIGCGGFHAHLPCVCLRREEVDCPPVVYWYCLSFMMTRAIFQRKRQNVLLFLNFLFLTAFFMSLFLYQDIACTCCMNGIKYLFFNKVVWTQKQGYQMTHSLSCLYCIVSFQNPLKHIRRLIHSDISVCCYCIYSTCVVHTAVCAVW